MYFITAIFGPAFGLIRSAFLPRSASNTRGLWRVVLPGMSNANAPCLGRASGFSEDVKHFHIQKPDTQTYIAKFAVSSLPWATRINTRCLDNQPTGSITSRRLFRAVILKNLSRHSFAQEQNRNNSLWKENRPNGTEQHLIRNASCWYAGLAIIF